MKKSYTGGAQMGSISTVNANSSKLNSAGGRTMKPVMSGSMNPGGYIKREPSCEGGPVPLPGQPKG
jgi:hypothetical protein